MMVIEVLFCKFLKMLDRTKLLVRFSIKRVILIGLKIALSSFLLWHLISKFGHEFSLLTVRPNWGFLMLSVILFSLSQLFSIWRWQVCCEGLNIFSKNLGGFFPRLNFQLLRIYFIGFFGNNFLPGSFGGDLIRAYLLKKHHQHLKWVDCAGSVLIDRIFGLLTLCWVGFVSAFMIRLQVSELHLSSPQLALGLIHSTEKLMGCICLFSVCGVLSLPLLGRFLPLPSIHHRLHDEKSSLKDKLLIKALEALEAFKKIRKNHLVVFQLLIGSLLIQVLVTLCLFSLAWGLNLNIPTFLLWPINPLTTFASLLAPTINGLGVREGISAYYFQAFGRPGAEGMMLSAAWLLCLLVSSLPGAYFILTRKKSKEKSQTHLPPKAFNKAFKPLQFKSSLSVKPTDKLHTLKKSPGE